MPKQDGLAPTLMVQGTASGVGKSLIVAALCRLLKRRGVNVVPFKAQNMSNNAAVTADGGEIGRAQALQARAAGLDPHVDMNPLLLKPMGDTRSDVVVLGQSRPDLTNTPWKERGPAIWPVVDGALRRLRQQYDFVVIEGAGSPAEINLRPGDYVNMGLARHAGSPVVIVADIDKGGAFASLFGTWGLLDDADRSHIKAFILNKFRGDASLLAPAPEILEERTGVPVVGVIPRVTHLLPEEDGAGDGMLDGSTADVRIGVVALPRASNIDDFDPLRAEPNVRVEKIDRAEQLHGLRAVILPGTRNTPGDLTWLWETGLADGIRSLARTGVAVVGLCGGYQMLGRSVHDDHQIENQDSTTTPGLDLLPIRTRYAVTKNTKVVDGAVVRSGPHMFSELSGQHLDGYEIHHGETESDGAVAWLDYDGREIGHSTGAVWGSYVHGVFGNDTLRALWLRSIGADTDGTAWRARLDAEIDRWADVVEAHVDVDRLIDLARR